MTALVLQTGLDAVPRAAAAGLIRAYQVWLSPRKGFCCAHGHRPGRLSCSEYGRRLVLRRGVLALAQGMPRQFARCRRAYSVLQAEAAEPEPSGEDEKRDARQGSAWWSDCLGGMSGCDLGPCVGQSAEAASSSLGALDCAGGAGGAVDCLPCACSF